MLWRSTVNNDNDNENINLKKGGVRERFDLPLSINYQQVRVVLAYHPVRLDLKGKKKKIHDCKTKCAFLTLNFRDKNKNIVEKVKI